MMGKIINDPYFYCRILNIIIIGVHCLFTTNTISDDFKITLKNVTPLGINKDL